MAVDKYKGVIKKATTMETIAAAPVNSIKGLR
jgi:hypothetical protein